MFQTTLLTLLVHETVGVGIGQIDSALADVDNIVVTLNKQEIGVED